jgi:hypothetical protein
MASRVGIIETFLSWDSVQYLLGCDEAYRRELNDFLDEVPHQVREFNMLLKTWKGNFADVHVPFCCGSKNRPSDGYFSLCKLGREIAAQDWSIVSRQEEWLHPYPSIVQTICRCVASIFKQYLGIASLEVRYQEAFTNFIRISEESHQAWRDLKEKMEIVYQGTDATGKDFCARKMGVHDRGTTLIVERKSDEMVLTRTIAESALYIEKIQAEDFRWMIQIALHEMKKNPSVQSVKCFDLSGEQSLIDHGFAKVEDHYVLYKQDLQAREGLGNFGILQHSLFPK